MTRDPKRYCRSGVHLNSSSIGESRGRSQSRILSLAVGIVASSAILVSTVEAQYFPTPSSGPSSLPPSLTPPQSPGFPLPPLVSPSFPGSNSGPLSSGGPMCTSKDGQGTATCLNLATIVAGYGMIEDYIKNPTKTQFSNVGEIESLLSLGQFVAQGEFRSGKTKLGSGAFRYSLNGVEAEFTALNGAELVAAVNSSGLVCFANVDQLKVSLTASSEDSFGIKLFTENFLSSVDMQASYAQELRSFHFSSAITDIKCPFTQTGKISASISYSDSGHLKAGALDFLLKDLTFQNLTVAAGCNSMKSGSGISSSLYLSQRCEVSLASGRSPYQVKAFIDSGASVLNGRVSASRFVRPGDAGNLSITNTINNGSVTGITDRDLLISSGVNLGIQVEY